MEKKLELYNVSVRFSRRIATQIVIDATDADDARAKVQHILWSEHGGEIDEVVLFDVTRVEDQNTLRDEFANMDTEEKVIN